MEIQQDWDASMLRAYLLRDYWTLKGGLCILTGFDYSACIESAPYQPQWMHTLDPCTLQGHCGEDADKAEELLNRMNDDLVQLRIIWVGCKRDIEAEDFPPAFFIEWALSKNFIPDWLDWAIRNNLYTSKETGPTNEKDAPGTNSPHTPDKYDDAGTRRIRLYAEIAEIPNYKTIGKPAIRKILTTNIGKGGSCITSLGPDAIYWTDCKGDKQSTTYASLGKWLSRQK